MENEKEVTEIIPDSAAEATTPEKEITIPVKFNKETKNLTLDEAIMLSQKGMKFDSLSRDIDRLKELARMSDKSVSEYLSELEQARTDKYREELVRQCGGNTEIAERLITLEKKDSPAIKGEEELEEFFPGMKASEVPEEVAELCRMKNTNLVNELLRYNAKKELSLSRQKQKQSENERADTGSLKTSKSPDNPESAEFIRGIWSR